MIHGPDYMKIFNLGWKFRLVFRVNSKLLFKCFKMTLQLHVKVSTWYAELKFQLRLAKSRWNFNPGWKFQISHIIYIFSNPQWKYDTTRAQIPCLFLKKVKMATSQVHFKWTDDKSIFLIKCLQFKGSMEFRNCNSKADKVKLYESVRKSKYIYIYIYIYIHI